jgi:hypothetical protein
MSLVDAIADAVPADLWPLILEYAADPPAFEWLCTTYLDTVLDRCPEEEVAEIVCMQLRAERARLARPRVEYVPTVEERIQGTNVYLEDEGFVMPGVPDEHVLMTDLRLRVHVEDHDGYCSGEDADDDLTVHGDRWRTVGFDNRTVVRRHRVVDVKQFKHLEREWACKSSVDYRGGSGYCDCRSSMKVIGARIHRRGP